MNFKAIIPTIFGAFAAVTSAQAMTFVVNKNADDGSAHTLRWAIQQSNALGGANTIIVEPASRNWVIQLQSPLPPIRGPAVIRGLGVEDVEYTLPPSAETQVTQPLQVPASYGKPSVVLDGSSFINPEYRRFLPGPKRGRIGTQCALLVVSGPSGCGFRQRGYQRL